MNVTNPEQGAGSPFEPVRELPYYSWTEFDSINLVKATIKRLEQGQFDTPAQLVDAMHRDDRISGCLLKRSSALPSLPLTVEKGKGRAARKLAKAIEDGWHTMFPDAALTELSDWAIMLGLGVGENIWERNPKTGLLEFRLKVWHPRFIYWRWDTRSFWVNTENDTREIQPHTGQWVLYAPWGLERAWMRGLVRSLYVPWLLRQWAQRDSGRYSEVYGTPIKKALVPAGATEKDKSAFMRAVARIANDSTVRVNRAATPEGGFDLELLEATGAGAEVFASIIDKADTNIAICILGQNLTTEVKAGALASTSIHQAIEAGVLQQDADKLSECLLQQSLRYYARFNFGPEAEEQLPEVRWDTKPPEDKGQSATTLKSVGDGVVALRTAGFAVDAHELAERFNVPIVEGSMEAELAPQDEEPEPEEGQEEPPTKETMNTQLAKGKHLPPSKDEVLAQMRVDDLVADSTRAGKAALSSYLDRIAQAVTEAGDFADLKDRITKLYAGADDDQLATVLTAALAIAELEGRFAAKGDDE